MLVSSRCQWSLLPPSTVQPSVWQGQARRAPAAAQASKLIVAEANITLPALFCAPSSQANPIPLAHRPATAPETLNRRVSSSTAGALSSIRSDAVVPPSLVLGPRAVCGPVVVVVVVVLGCWAACSHFTDLVVFRPGSVASVNSRIATPTQSTVVQQPKDPPSRLLSSACLLACNI